MPQPIVDPGKLGELRPHLDFLATLDPSPDGPCPNWETVTGSLSSVNLVVSGLLTFIHQHNQWRAPHAGGAENASSGGGGPPATADLGGKGTRSVGGAAGAGGVGGNGMGGGGTGGNGTASGGGFGGPAGHSSRYKTSICRDSLHGSCPRGDKCTFAHSQAELDQHRRRRGGSTGGNAAYNPNFGNKPAAILQQRPTPQQQQQQAQQQQQPPSYHHMGHTPVAKVCPIQQGVQVHSPPVAMYQQDMYSANQVQAVMNAAPPPHPPPQAAAVAAAPPIAVMPNQAVIAPTPQVAAAAAAVVAPAPAQAATDPINSTEHDSNFDRFPVLQEGQLSAMQSLQRQPPVRMATKSLSALKSRKEEIIDHLEDLVGKEETQIITNIANESSHSIHPPAAIPPTIKSKAARAAVAAAAAAIENDPSSVAAVLNQSNSASAVSSAAFSSQENYSIWTTRPIAGLPASPDLSFSGGPDAACDNSSLGSDGFQGMEEVEGEEEEEEDELTASMIKTSRTLVDNIVSSYGEDEIIPFSDTPQISRFGPISRKAGTTLLQTATPSQTQAVISDEPTATAVVRHSKQSSRQVPSLASLYHRNGEIISEHFLWVHPFPNKFVNSHVQVLWDIPCKSPLKRCSRIPV